MCKNLFLVRTSMTENWRAQSRTQNIAKKKNDILCVLVSVFILDILLIITYLLSMQFHIHKKNGVVAF